MINLPYRRTWLVIAAVGLLLAGVVVMLVVKLVEPPPPLPTGRTIEDHGGFEIALELTPEGSKRLAGGRRPPEPVQRGCSRPWRGRRKQTGAVSATPPGSGGDDAAPRWSSTTG